MSCSTYLTFILVGIIVNMVILHHRTEAQQYEDNNREVKTEVSAIKRPSFFVGSRYGRSQYIGGKSALTNLNIVPRNDRFFLGSRYGKRSDESMQEVIDPEKSTQDLNVFTYMSCLYTGVKDFYRCYTNREHHFNEDELNNSSIDNNNHIKHNINDDDK